MAAVASVGAPAGADAKTYYRYHQVNLTVPATLSRHIGFIPIKSIAPLDKVVTFRVGRDRVKGTWNNNIFGGLRSTTFILKITREEGRRGGVDDLVLTDRALTVAERRTFKVLADLGRDADVLVVARDHPACGGGLTSSQARQIASGAVTRWSQVMPLPAGQPDAIALHHTVAERAFEGRFGLDKLPAGARGVPDGGMSAAASGDRTVAGITAWSRYRSSRGGCAVPLDGVAPTNETVHGLRFPGAHPVQLVSLRMRQHPYERALRAAYVRFMKSARAGRLLKRNGMLLAAESPPADAPSTTGTPPGTPSASGGPSQRYDGSPITPIRDDAAALTALTGERLERAQDSVTTRFAFDADHLLRRLDMAPDGTNCRAQDGAWEIEAAWRYEEYGGGVIARVRLTVAGATRTATIELANDLPGSGYIDAVPHTRSRDLAANC